MAKIGDKIRYHYNFVRDRRMARPSTPRLSTCLDQSYSCSTCNTQDLDLEQDVDQENWCCMECGESIDIKMLDDGGYTYSVKRLPAHELQPGDSVLVETNYGDPRAYHARRVFDACRSVSRPGQWEVAIEKHTRVKVDRDRYYNCPN